MESGKITSLKLDLPKVWPATEASVEVILRKHGYTITGTIGKGSYAKVKKGRSKQHQCQVAIKIIDLRTAPDDFINKFLPRERAIHSHIKHPNCIQLLDEFQFGSKIYFIMELAGHGDLLEYIKLRTRLLESEAKPIIRQLVEAVRYLHNKGIAHRDLKCENILMDIYNNVKLSDFGFCRVFEAGSKLSKTYCGSAAYASPEILQGIPYNPPVADMWSLGVILFITVNGTMPFDDTHLKKLLRAQINRTFYFSSKVNAVLTDHYKSLVRLLLEPNPERRGSIANLLSSNWLANTEYTVRTAKTAQPLISYDQNMPYSTAAPRVRRKSRSHLDIMELAPADAKARKDLPLYFVPSSSRPLQDLITQTVSDEELQKKQLDNSPKNKPAVYVKKTVKTRKPHRNIYHV